MAMRRKAKRRTKARRKTTKRTRRPASRKKKVDASKAANRKALWKAYRGLQKRADKAWDKFRKDIKKGASSDILIRDNNQLLLLLGECNYMARECMRLASKKKR